MRLSLLLPFSSLLILACAQEPVPCDWATVDGECLAPGVGDSSAADEAELACQGDNPCSANAYCDEGSDDPRCFDCPPDGDVRFCSPVPAGTCVPGLATDGLSCFPRVDAVATGHCSAGRCVGDR